MGKKKGRGKGRKQSDVSSIIDDTHISSVIDNIHKQWEEIAQHPLKNRVSGILDNAHERLKEIEYHSPKVYQRTKKRDITVSDVLKKTGIKIKITAKPEDWKTIRDFYQVFKREFYADVFPLMQAAYFKTHLSKISF